MPVGPVKVSGIAVPPDVAERVNVYVPVVTVVTGDIM
jgi:hypothetical protein